MNATGERVMDNMDPNGREQFLTVSGFATWDSRSSMCDFGFAIQDLRCRICDVRFAVQDAWFKICDSTFAVIDFRFRISDLGFAFCICESGFAIQDL